MSAKAAPAKRELRPSVQTTPTGVCLEGSDLLNVEFEPAAGYPVGAGYVGAGEVLGCAYVDDLGEAAVDELQGSGEFDLA